MTLFEDEFKNNMRIGNNLINIEKSLYDFRFVLRENYDEF